MMLIFTPDEVAQALALWVKTKYSLEIKPDNVREVSEDAYEEGTWQANEVSTSTTAGKGK